MYMEPGKGEPMEKPFNKDDTSLFDSKLTRKFWNTLFIEAGIILLMVIIVILLW